MDAEAALEQLRALHQRKTQQIDHVQSLTADFRQWRGEFTGQLATQREDMQNMRKQLHEDALRQRAEFQEMQAELQRQLEDLVNSNLSAFPALAVGGAPARARSDDAPPQPSSAPGPARQPPLPADPPAEGEASLAAKLSRELGIPLALLASDAPPPARAGSAASPPLPAEPQPPSERGQPQPREPREPAAAAPRERALASRSRGSEDSGDESESSWYSDSGSSDGGSDGGSSFSGSSAASSYSGGSLSDRSASTSSYRSDASSRRGR